MIEYDYVREDFQTRWGWWAFNIIHPFLTAILYAIRPFLILIVKVWEYKIKRDRVKD